MRTDERKLDERTAGKVKSTFAVRSGVPALDFPVGIRNLQLLRTSRNARSYHRSVLAVTAGLPPMVTWVPDTKPLPPPPQPEHAAAAERLTTGRERGYAPCERLQFCLRGP